MNLSEHIYLSFGEFKDEKCQVSRSDCTYPELDESLEAELAIIREHVPISLPEDYCEVFRLLGNGWIEDKREKWRIPDMTFMTWEDMEELNYTIEFFSICPNAFPFGDDVGDIFYFYGEGSEGLGIYMAEAGVFIKPENATKIADSFTQLLRWYHLCKMKK